MISFAQNFEDVILHRAFATIKNGYYIDIGAQDSVIDSVSNHFYNLGWSEINVELVPFFANVLREAHPRDLVLQKAVKSCNAKEFKKRIMCKAVLERSEFGSF